MKDTSNKSVMRSKFLRPCKSTLVETAWCVLHDCGGMFDRTDCVKVIQSIGDVSKCHEVLQENDGGDPKTMKTRQPLVPLAPEAPTQRTMCVLASAYYCFAVIGVSFLCVSR